MKKIYIELQNFCINTICNTKCKAQKTPRADRYIMSSSEVAEIFNTIPNVIEEDYCIAMYGCGDSSDYPYADLDIALSTALQTYAVINRNYSKVSFNPILQYVARFYTIEDLIEIVSTGVYKKAISVVKRDTPLFDIKLLKEISKTIWIEFYPDVNQFEQALKTIEKF